MSDNEAGSTTVSVMSGVNHDLYAVIMRCLQSAAYAGGAFQEKAFQWLDESQALSQAEREAGWFKLHDEYEALSVSHWESVWKNLDDRKYAGWTGCLVEHSTIYGSPTGGVAGCAWGVGGAM